MTAEGLERMFRQRFDRSIEQLQRNLDQENLALQEDLRCLNHYKAIVENRSRKIQQFQSLLDSLMEDELQWQRHGEDHESDIEVITNATAALLKNSTERFDDQRPDSLTVHRQQVVVDIHFESEENQSLLGNLNEIGQQQEDMTQDEIVNVASNNHLHSREPITTVDSVAANDLDGEEQLNGRLCETISEHAEGEPLDQIDSFESERQGNVVVDCEKQEHENLLDAQNELETQLQLENVEEDTVEISTQVDLRPSPVATDSLGKRSHFCSICDKSFKRKAHLVEHMRIHSGENCDICDRSFKQKAHLVNHMKTRCDDRPFSCSDCDKTYKWKKVLARHILLAHKTT